jgi:hypothetical protein
MGTPRRHALGLLLLLTLTPAVSAAPPDAKAVTRRIDVLLAEAWKEGRVDPAGRSGDAEFLRRAHLDITGKTPSVVEVRRFLADTSADKRDKLIDRLLTEPTHAAFFGTQWRYLLAPDAEANPGRQGALEGLDAWLRRQFAGNVPYDQWVREVLTFPPQGRLDVDPATPSPRLFYLGREDKPEDLAAATTRLFLGVRLECAQCHNHPFAPWKQEQFWSQAAFFVGLRKPGARGAEIPGKGQTVNARFLDGREPAGGDARAALAAWVTDAHNPYFAPAIVNRLWAHFFGIGLVDPLDDFTPENPPSHPQVLAELSRAFVESGHDLRFLVRVLTQTRLYHMTSASPDGNATAPRRFGRMNVKGLTPDQLFNSLVEAAALRGAQLPRLRARFLTRFPRTGGIFESRTSVSQALALMNGELLAAAVDPGGDNAVGAVVASPFLDTGGQIETLFLAALSRLPRDAERQRFVSHVEKSDDRSQALSDVMWALLNSPEFLCNH